MNTYATDALEDFADGEDDLSSATCANACAKAACGFATAEADQPSATRADTYVSVDPMWTPAAIPIFDITRIEKQLNSNSRKLDAILAALSLDAELYMADTIDGAECSPFLDGAFERPMHRCRPTTCGDTVASQPECQEEQPYNTLLSANLGPLKLEAPLSLALEEAQREQALHDLLQLVRRRVGEEEVACEGHVDDLHMQLEEERDLCENYMRSTSDFSNAERSKLEKQLAALQDARKNGRAYEKRSQQWSHLKESPD